FFYVRHPPYSTLFPYTTLFRSYARFLFANVGRADRGADSPGERPVPAGSVARQRGRFAKGGGGSMKNLDSVLAAYLAGWAIFFVYYISVAQRLSTLREEVERLKALLTKGR